MTTSAGTGFIIPPGTGTISPVIPNIANGDKFLLRKGTYFDNVVIDRSLSITGAGSAKTKVNGGGAGSVFTIMSGAVVTLADMTITGGKADFGGGINNGGTLTLNNVLITKNSANIGGGISNGGTATVSGSTISGNSAVFGGGIDNSGIDYGVGTIPAELTVLSSTVSHNIATYGGGIINNGNLYVGGTTKITNNQATGYGGGILSGDLLVTFDGTGVAVKNNMAHLPDSELNWYQGWGVYSSSGVLPITINGFNPATQVTGNKHI